MLLHFCLSLQSYIDDTFFFILNRYMSYCKHLVFATKTNRVLLNLYFILCKLKLFPTCLFKILVMHWIADCGELIWWLKLFKFKIAGLLAELVTYWDKVGLQIDTVLTLAASEVKMSQTWELYAGKPSCPKCANLFCTMSFLSTWRLT